MKHFLIAILSLAVAFPLAGCSSSSVKKVVSSVTGGSKALTATEIAAGLKEALNSGINTGIKALSATNGYYNDAAVKIGLPSQAAVITSNISKLPGGQTMVDNVIKNINAAASDAAGESVSIFTSAVTSMTISDAKTILKGSNDAATAYFETKTRSSLKSLFSKYMSSSLNKKLVGDVSAQSSWNTLTTKWNKVATSTAGKIAGLTSVNTNLVDYTTDKAVDGIFYKIAQQEKNIRTNVSARTTTLLKRVFAAQ